MKKILLIFMMASYFGFAEEEIGGKDSDYDYNFVLSFGGGMSFFQSYIIDYFNNSPTINLGVEIPFTRTHRTSIEFLTHSWFARKKLEIDPFDIVNSRYFQISDNYYSQIGLSGVIKVYLIGDKDSFFRINLHLGLLAGSRDYNSLDVGGSILFRLSEQFGIQLNNRYLLIVPNIADGSTQFTPNLLLLNLCYKFKWKIL